MAEDRATLELRLQQALAARHAWRTGATRSAASFGDRSITYSVEGIKQLDAYIAELRRALAGTAAGGRSRIAYVVPM